MKNKKSLALCLIAGLLIDPDSVYSRYRIWNHVGRTGGGAEKSSCCLPSVHRHRINIMKKVKRSAKRNWIQLASAVFFNGYALGYQWGHSSPWPEAGNSVSPFMCLEC